MSNVFTVDRLGLRKRLPLSRAILELLQNALDTDATNIDLSLTRIKPGLWELVVSDDDPNGYVDLSHTYTLFARSTKVADDSKAGMFNIGEKLMMAWTERGSISSTTGTVVFDLRADTRSRSKKCTTVGSLHRFEIKLNETQADEMVRLAKTIIVDREGVTVTINGEVLEHRPVLMETTATLALTIENPDNPDEMITRQRLTRITVHAGDPQLHVIGLPVCSIDVPYTINVHGRLKQDISRDQIPPRQMHRIRVAIADLLAANDRLTEDDAQTWAKPTLKDAAVETVKTMVDLRFGVDAVVYDMSDRDANTRAMDHDRSVIMGGSFSAQEWNNVKRTREAFPAFAPPSGQTEFATLTEGMLSDPELHWTPEAEAFVTWVRRAYKHLTGRSLKVTIFGGKDAPGVHAAAGHGELSFNLKGLGGWKWFESSNVVDQLSLVIHEFGHLLADGQGHNANWAEATHDAAAKLMVWGVLPQ